MPTDRFDQYSEDTPTFTQAQQPYQWVEPTRSRPSRRVSMGAGGGFGGVSSVGGGGGGGGGRVSSTQSKHMTGDEVQQRWDRSQARADRLQRQYEGTQDWSGSPQDMEDLVGPERSGGMEKVTSGPTTTGLLRRDEDWGTGTAGVRVPAKPNGNGNGNGLSGGAARPVPTGVGANW